MNPFSGKRRPVDKREKLIGREQAFDDMNFHMENGDHTVIMGVEGSGKSSFLKCFFNNEYRLAMAREEKKLISVATEFPTSVDGEGVYGFFVGKVTEALRLLDQEEQKKIEAELASISKTPAAVWFESTVNTIDLCGYKMVFVLDNFERFTSSENVTMAHHELMRTLLDKTQYVVATNYDLNKDSLPKGVRGSYLIQAFEKNIITMDGFSPEESGQYLESNLRKSELVFSPNLIEELHAATGGIPQLLHTAAFYTYELLEQEELTTIKGTAVTKQLFADTKMAMEKWCMLLTPNQVRVLKELKQRNGIPNTLDESAAELLLARGILREVYVKDENGRSRKQTGSYQYNSTVFAAFCTKEDEQQKTLMERAAAKNPFLDGEENAEKAVGSYRLAEQLTNGQGTVIINGPVFMNGSSQNNNVHIEKVSLLQSIGSPEQLLGVLTSFQNRIAGDDSFLVDQNVDEQTLELRYDQAANRIAEEFLPAQVPTQEELQTLDERFAEVRSIRPEVTDIFLDGLSEECRFYLKIAIVVEDALKILHTVRLGDFSAQLVMYGKVLEQCLRDNMYHLFSTEHELKDWDLYKHEKKAGSRQSFGGMQVTGTFIGNYIYMMRDKRNYLAQICQNNTIESEEAQQQTAEEWKRWWKNLHDNVNAARVCRNTADHAGSQSEKDDLTTICDLLFGDGGIMVRCGVADRLYEKIK